MDALTAANLLAWSLQAGVIVLVAAPLPRVLGLWSPRVRMAYWRVVLVACLMLPLLQPWVVRQAPPLRAALEIGATTSVVATPGGSASAATSVAPQPLPPWRRPLPFGAADVLVAGVLLRLGWLGLGVITVWRLRRSARRLWPRPDSIDRAATLAETDAEFLVSATASRPVTCGVLWPVVLVPRTFESFPEPEQTAIACHELLHVGRSDWLRNAIDEVVRAILWFHPAIWWLINQIQLAREQVVDREAVRRLGARQAYLEALLRMARPAPRLILSPATLFLKRAHLRQRVTLLVKEVSMSKARLAATFAVMAAIVFIGGSFATSAFPLQQAGARATAVHATQQKPPATNPPSQGALSPGAGPAGGTKPGVSTGTATGVGSGAGSGVGSGASTGVAGGVAGGVPGGVPTGVAGGTPGGVSGGLASGVGATGQGGGVTYSSSTPSVVKRVDPDAPGLAGRVIMAAIIAPDGSVSTAGRADADGMVVDVAVAEAARQAMLQWVFEPGQAEQRTAIVGFNLTQQNTGGAVDPTIVRIGGKIPPPLKVRDVKPVYPKEAQEARLQGVQILDISVDPSGAVLDARVLRGQYPLLRAAIDAVLQWQFTEWAGPERRLMTVTVNFTLDGGASNLLVPVRDTPASAASGRPVEYGQAANWPPDAIRVGGNIKPPTRIVDVKPVYPAVAQQERVQGVVIYEVLVGPDGRVMDARVLRSIPLLDQAGLDAVRQWVFTPTLLNGNPVPVITTVTVNFTLE